MRFLHAADLHLDSPLRGLARYDGAPVDRLRTATRAALERLTDRALDEKIDFLLLAGDLYDRDWQDFHTGLFFREQMARLHRAAIPVFIVQGNHDAQGVISRQLSLPPNCHVFSAAAAETRRIDALAVAIHGRSFPDRSVEEDFVPGYPAPLPGYFNIGLLHTSLNGRQGHDTYAPTSLAALANKGYDYWALGHVHAREVVCEHNPRVVFPGNLQGRHANETGAKGCERVTVENGHINSEAVALDVARWHQLHLNVDGIASVEALHAAFRAAIAPLLAGAGDRLHAVRINLSGATDLSALEARQPGTLAAELRGAAQDVAEAEIWIEQVRLALNIPHDRAEAAARQDAIGELVRLVDSLAADATDLQQWAQGVFGDVFNTLPPEVKTDDSPNYQDPAELQALLKAAEATVLARLLAST